MGRIQKHLWDGLLTLALLAIGLAGTTPSARNQGVEHVGWWGYALVVVAALAMLGRRHVPYGSLAVTGGATALYLLAGYPAGPIVFSLLVAFYTTAAYRPFRIAAAACASACVAVVLGGWIGNAYGLDWFLPAIAWAVAPFALGSAVRVRRLQTRQARRDEARRQADAERMRVAQEVHDVVGHGLAAIHMQAEIALHLLAKQPGQAETALVAISRTSRESLDELRATLGAVRRGEGVDDRTATAGLARLDALADRVRSAGVPVRVRVDGAVAGLPTAVDLAAYRVVQEALTNVLRHAGPATADVLVTRDDGELRLRVTDTGAGSASEADGHGITGMRERVTALGGALSAAPSGGGGFTVEATIPIGHDESEGR